MMDGAGRRLVDDEADRLKIGQLFPAVCTRAHVELERDPFRESDVPVEERGKRLASFLTIHAEECPRILPWMILQGGRPEAKLR